VTTEHAAAQIKALVSRWEAEDGEFARFYTRRIDTLEMLGAGNAAGAVAVAAFLTSGTRAGEDVVAAKICLAVFFVGARRFHFRVRVRYRRCSNATPKWAGH
jgi:hypothetical protein